MNSYQGIKPSASFLVQIQFTSNYNVSLGCYILCLSAFRKQSTVNVCFCRAIPYLVLTFLKKDNLNLPDRFICFRTATMRHT